MSISTDNPHIYNDPQAIASLRSRAQQDPQAALREVARQFEALFLQELLKGMRNTSLGEGLFESDQTKTFQEMSDRQLASDLAGKGAGLGLADMLVQQLGGEGSAPRSNGNGLAARQLVSPIGTANQRQQEGSMAAGQSVGEPLAPVAAEWQPATPEAFVRDLWPHAERAAGELGVAPEVLIAQAALETGWGRGVSRHTDGSSSNNLFNIKADRRWQGDSVKISTLEYRDGIAVRERAAFRAYPSHAESFDDYVDFLRTNPRYSEALANSSDPQRYVESLQAAGYATDPAYAKKIGAILARDELKGVVAELESGSTMPLT
jgi:flagellar protein FlgJ